MSHVHQTGTTGSSYTTIIQGGDLALAEHPERFETVVGEPPAGGQQGIYQSATPPTDPQSITVNTTNATTTTIATIPVPSGSTILIEASLIGRRTGGSAGTTGDTASYVFNSTVRNISGTVTKLNESELSRATSQAWDWVITISGTTALIQVTGALNNNISWLCNYQLTISM